MLLVQALKKHLANTMLQGYTVITTLLAHESRDHLTDFGIHAFAADVTRDDDISELRNDVEEIVHGSLDVLVNNA